MLQFLLILITTIQTHNNNIFKNIHNLPNIKSKIFSIQLNPFKFLLENQSQPYYKQSQNQYHKPNRFLQVTVDQNYNDCVTGQKIIAQFTVNNTTYKQQLCYCPYDYYGQYCQVHISPTCKFIRLNKTQQNISIDKKLSLLYSLQCFNLSSSASKYQGIKTYYSKYQNMKNATDLHFYNKDDRQIDLKNLRLDYKNISKLLNFTNSQFFTIIKTINWLDSTKNQIIYQKIMGIQQIVGVPFKIQINLQNYTNNAKGYGIIYLEMMMYQRFGSQERMVIQKSERFQIIDPSYQFPEDKSSSFGWKFIIIGMLIVTLLVLIGFWLIKKCRK